MSDSYKCIDCGVEVSSIGARCAMCEAGTAAGEGMLVTIDHSPSARRAADHSAAAVTSGENLGGYRVIRTLGKGGMGSVYEAEEIESGRRVALKLFGQSLDSSDSKRRFLSYGRLAA